MYKNAANGKALIEGTALAAMRGERLLFSGVNVTAVPENIVLLRGRNGNGKTTLLRQLAGLCRPVAGSVTHHQPYHWIGHENGLKAHETPRSHLRHWACVWGAQVDIAVILEHMTITPVADISCRLLSAGQKRRTALGRLLLNERPLWLLDEPGAMLDTNGQALLTEMITAHCRTGGAVISAWHGNTSLRTSMDIIL